MEQPPLTTPFTARLFTLRFLFLLTIAVLLFIILFFLYKIVKEKNATRIPINNQLSTDTKNWQLYKSGSFTVKYPPSYTIRDEGQLIGPTQPVTFKGEYGDEIKITAFTPSGYTTIQDLLGKGPLLSYEKNLLQSKEIKEITIDGYKGIWVSDINGPNGSARDLIVITEKYAYQIVALPINTQNARVFDLMVATMNLTAIDIEKMKCNEATELAPKASCPEGYVCNIPTNATNRQGTCKKK